MMKSIDKYILQETYRTIKSNTIVIIVQLKTTREHNITDILTQIRAVKGVVTVNILKPTKNISDIEHLTLVKIRIFIFKHTFAFIKHVFKEIKKINGVSSFKIITKKGTVPYETKKEKIKEDPPFKNAQSN